MKRVLIGFMFLLVGLGWFLALEGATAYDVPAGTTTWGQALSQNRTAVVVTVHDADASLQTYLDGTRLDSILLLRGQPYPYWGEIDSLNIVRPISTRGTVQLGPPGSRDAPFGGGSALPGWKSESVYLYQAATVTDTTFISTGWGASDGGQMFLIFTGDSITAGTQPTVAIKSVHNGFWVSSYLQSNASDPGATVTIADNTNSYNIWVLTSYLATLKNTAPPGCRAFGDSICVIYTHGDASAGTITLDVFYRKD